MVESFPLRPGSDVEGIAPLERPRARTSHAQAISLLINAAVGAGVLSLPFAFRQAGWAGGTLILLAVATVESFTLYVLSKWAERHGAVSYGELVHRALGPAAATALSLVVFLYLFGSAVAYMVILGDCFHPLAAAALGDAWYTTRRAVITATGVFVLLPLSFAETLSAAATISAVNFGAFALVVAAIVGRSAATIAAAAPPRFAAAAAFSPSWPAALPIAVFGLQCHAQVVAVFSELEAEAAEADTDTDAGPGAGGSQGRRRRRRSPKLLAMTRVIIVAIATTATGYALVGLPAYLAFPSSVRSNFLNTFPAGDALMQGVRALVGAIELASYPVNHLPARQAVRDAAATALGAALAGPAFVAAETLAFFLGSLAIALAVQDLGAVFALTGGLCGAAIILGMPGLLLIENAWAKHRAAKIEAVEAQEALTDPLGVPLLTSIHGEGGGGARYSLWRSKLFWAGVGLSGACLALMGSTVATVLTSP